jgi:hypothetical protein
MYTVNTLNSCRKSLTGPAHEIAILLALSAFTDAFNLAGRQQCVCCKDSLFAERALSRQVEKSQLSAEKLQIESGSRSLKRTRPRYGDHYGQLGLHRPNRHRGKVNRFCGFKSWCTIWCTPRSQTITNGEN